VSAPDIDAAGAVDDAVIVDLDPIAQPHAAIAALHIGIAVQRHLVAECHAGAARGIDRGIGVDLAAAAQLDFFVALEIDGEGHAVAGAALLQNEENVFQQTHPMCPRKFS